MTRETTKHRLAVILFIGGCILSILPMTQPGVALFMGIAIALTVGNPYHTLSKKTSKHLLQWAVVGLGFGMNVEASLASGKEGMSFTVVSVIGVLVIGWMLGKWLKINKKASYLISSGTAICGGSAIAAVAPVIDANDQEITLSMGTVFILNAVALFAFPVIGEMLHMTQEQFGMWCAIAIHDTSSVVGAGAAYGPKALEVATLVKLTRALWIIPLSIVTAFIFKSGKGKIKYPWFILFFVGAMLVNSYMTIPVQVGELISLFSHRALALTLFLIGTGLSLEVVKKVGVRPLIMGIILWFLISIVSLVVIL